MNAGWRSGPEICNGLGADTPRELRERLTLFCGLVNQWDLYRGHVTAADEADELRERTMTP